MADSNTADLLIVGGGAAGAALAGIVARDTDARVLLLEAGPDYGALSEGRWPADLLDARRFPVSHDWGFSGIGHSSHTEAIPFQRARAIGGCSAHNGCVAIAGHRRDYDGWAALGNPGWDYASVAPALARARQGLRVRIPDEGELQPFMAAFLEAAVAAGHARVPDLDDPDIADGVAPSPANIVDGIRWSAALGYLDPVRGKGNLTIVPHALVDRVVIENGRATGVEVIVDGARQVFHAGQVVLSGGAYGTPAILLRSGVGEPRQLGALGIAVTHDLPGVGKGLTDHPLSQVTLRPSDRLQTAMDAFLAAGRWLPDEQVVLKASSSRGEPADLHMPPFTTVLPDSGAWVYQISVSQFLTAGSGALTIASADPEAPVVIDHGYLSDPEDIDRTVLIDGLEQALEIAGHMQAAGVIEGVIEPAGTSRAELSRYVEAGVRTCFHPSCSCRMGPASNPFAVVDADARVHGLAGLAICDASIFPAIMRGNTNLPSVMLAEHLAGRFAR